MEEGFLRRFKERMIDKDMIIREAKKGTFNSNPLLSMPHEIFCEKCKHRQKIVYLENLKSGEFEIGRRRMEAIFYPQFGLRHIIEPITPLIIKTNCKRCESKIYYTPINVEYISFLIEEGKEFSCSYVC